MKRNQANNTILSAIANRLEELCDDFVFLGGCAAGLLITDNAAPEIRSTLDVDCIVDVVSLHDYYQLEVKLRQKGFTPSTDVICRWEIDRIKLDVMPTDPQILGFSNQWYKPAIATANWFELSYDLKIQLVAAPYFLATKYEAFLHRGNNDFYASHDLEDMVAVIDGREELIAECRMAAIELRSYIANICSHLLKQNRFLQALPGHLGGSREGARRMPIFLERFVQLMKLN